jgi:hypothetical protein
MVSLSMRMIGSRTICPIIHPQNKVIIRSHIMNLQLLVGVILILFITTNTVAGLNLTENGSTESSRFGNTISYDYVLINDNGVDLHDVVFTDDRLGSIAIGNLNNGATWTHSINHTINESDMPGPLRNNAWATGKKPDKSVVSSPVVFWTVSLAISGILAVDMAPDKGSRPIGGKVTYNISVTNGYPVTLDNLSITDAIYHPSAIALPITLDRTRLVPNQTAYGTVSYTVVHEDIQGPPLGIAGSGNAKVTNTVNATARFPWWSPANPKVQLASGRSLSTINVD